VNLRFHLLDRKAPVERRGAPLARSAANVECVTKRTAMETEEIEQHLQQRSAHHDAELVVKDGDRDGWRAAFARRDGSEVLAADGADRNGALQALYELDELEDLAGG
jgi:hypothetical protein